MSRLEELRQLAVEPYKIEALIHLIRNDLGYLLHKAVEQTKAELSAS